MTGNPKLRAIGRILKDEESRFIGYTDIEARTRELGFGMTVRTIRFYVDEGILPPPKKVGKTPVYEEDWILNVLLAVHLMKTRLNRSLTEVRTVLGRLQEEPAFLADKLSVLYEEHAREGGGLEPVQRQGLIDAFFDLLVGRLGPPRQASEVRLCELVDVIKTRGVWTNGQWTPPGHDAILASQGPTSSVAGLGPATPPPSYGPVTPMPPYSTRGLEAPGAELLGTTSRPLVAGIPPTAITPAPLPMPTPVPAPAPTAIPPTARIPAFKPTVLTPEVPPPPEPRPKGAIPIERARALEETFMARFEAGLERLERVHCPLDAKSYKSRRVPPKRDRATEVVDLMKRHRVFDRTLLDQIPLDVTCDVHVHQGGLFGRGDLKVIVTAQVLSPLEEFIQKRWSSRPLGALEIERAIEAMPLKDEVFHFLGLMSTTGWSPEATSRIPSRRNLLVCLVESAGGSAWRRHIVADPRWGGVERLFDPETDREKVDRARDHLREHLKPKGEFLILGNLPEDLDLPPECVQAALDEVLAEDTQLTVCVSGGREIVKRRRL